jgi:hypothetical protein
MARQREDKAEAAARAAIDKAEKEEQEAKVGARSVEFAPPYSLRLNPPIDSGAISTSLSSFFSISFPLGRISFLPQFCYAFLSSSHLPLRLFVEGRAKFKRLNGAVAPTLFISVSRMEVSMQTLDLLFSEVSPPVDRSGAPAA